MSIKPIGTSLLGSTSRVDTPFIKVTFGDRNSGYTFGVYQKISGKTLSNGFYEQAKIRYPNYVQSLQVEKINGQVNQYNLRIDYPIRPGDDPNFFEKIFSSISKNRKMYLSYGDISIPTYTYREEETIITNIQSSFSVEGSKITYAISAVSAASLVMSGNYNFGATQGKPSDIIAALIQNPAYGLNQIFYGMAGMSAADMRSLGLLPGDDSIVSLEAKKNISALEYLKYLVSCMIPSGASFNVASGSCYILTIHDDVTGATLPNTQVTAIGGPYIKIVKIDKNVSYSDAYQLDIGIPSKDVVLNFSISDNENYSIYYDWQSKLDYPSDNYVWRIGDDGEWQKEYAPVASSGNDLFKTTPDSLVWWTKVTQYPISATVTIKGLLRPATLMEYVKVNVYFYGQKHISSGTYIVTKQIDNVNSSGYHTTLFLTRVLGEAEEEYDS